MHKISQQLFMDLLGCGITPLNLSPSLAFMISILSSFFISALIFQLKKEQLSFFSSPNEKIKTPNLMSKDSIRKC
jgi:hypothetical protein